MKYLLLCLPFLMGFTPIYNSHDSLKKVDDEIKNMTDNLQSRQFTVVNTTPNYLDLQDGEMVVYSSFPFTPVSLMLRVGTTIYVSPYFQIMKGR